MKTINELRELNIRFIILFAALIIGIGSYTNKYHKEVVLYKQYYNAVEAVLDECDRIHNICDTVMEGDVYQDYIDAREKLGLE